MPAIWRRGRRPCSGDSWSARGLALVCLALGSVAGGIQCPPLLSEDHSRDCERVDSGLIQAIYDQASAVAAIATDAVEFGDQHPGTQLMSIVAFVDSLFDVLCVARYRLCYDDEVWPEVYRSVCGRLNRWCGKLADCSALTADACRSFSAGHLSPVLDVLAFRAAPRSSTNGAGASHRISALLCTALGSCDWLLPGPPKEVPCMKSTAPRRLLQLDLSVWELSAVEMQRHRYTHDRVVDLLLEHSEEGIPASSRWALNLGAGGLPDAANCIVDHGWPGILLEPQEHLSKELAVHFAGREDVEIVADKFEPAAMPRATAAIAQKLAGGTLNALAPGLLKIDVDNGDCEYLKALFDAGLRPLVVQMEIFHAYAPPAISVDMWFRKGLIGDVDTLWNSGSLICGCSLGTVVPILFEEYALVSLSRFRTTDVAFALEPWAASRGLATVKMRDVEKLWYQAVSFRERWHSANWYGLEVDVRWLANASVPDVEKGRVLSRMLSAGFAHWDAFESRS